MMNTTTTTSAVTSTTRLQKAFASAKKNGKAAFVSFVTAGYPTAEGKIVILFIRVHDVLTSCWSMFIDDTSDIYHVIPHFSSQIIQTIQTLLPYY